MKWSAFFKTAVSNRGSDIPWNMGNLRETTGTRLQPHRRAIRSEKSNYSIIAHSHLKWDWVWQRPQQFLSRLSKKHRVLFVEGPEPVEGLATARVALREVDDYPNVVVLQMQMPASDWNKPGRIDNERRRLLQSFLTGPLGRTFEPVVQWFYDPMAVTAFAGQMNELAIVYDCMDQLSQFRYAPPELVKRERELLAIADVVFAGGPKIWENKRQSNTNCFCYGCGVDFRHFGRTRDPKCVLPVELRNIPRPVFGYIGVVDERLDYELIARLAEANSGGSILMVGPSTKVDPEALPHRSNIHWLGGRDYSLLPNYAKAFDVCLMPFALNEATEFINPTKALEYMATGIPIVSTPVRDVVRQFSDVVTIARTPEEFAAACSRNAVKPNRSAVVRGLDLARNNSWESIVRKLEAHIEDAICRNSTIAISAA
jgi:glycosyltransferase involved in cell wall biosynthesis